MIYISPPFSTQNPKCKSTPLGNVWFLLSLFCLFSSLTDLFLITGVTQVV